MRVELFRGGGHHPWFYKLVAGNGQTVTVSEGYSRKWSARRAARKEAERQGIELVDATERGYISKEKK